MSSTVAHGFQYESASYQAQTALAGMWLFLASEVMFFDAGGREADLSIGTLNTFILVTSSCVYALGVQFLRQGNIRWMILCCGATLVLGLIFLALKFGVEWPADIAHHLFPTAANFKITGSMEGGARLFFIFYFFATALHGVHMVVGIGLLLWLIRRARGGDFSSGYHTPVIVVGIYWSFVDVVWLTLYPLIYLIGRAP